MSDGFTERMSYAIQAGGGPVEVARKTGLSRRVLDKYRSGDSDPSRTRLILIAEVSGVDVGWLATGAGEARPTGNTASVVERVSGADAWLMSRVIDGVQKAHDAVGVRLPATSLGEIAARIHNEIVVLEGGEEVWRGALALALNRLIDDLSNHSEIGTGKSSA